MTRCHPISALAHLLYCERRLALVYLERAWAENVETVEGRHLHQRADCPFASETRGEVRIARAIQLRSQELGLYGVADVVEFHKRPSMQTAQDAAAAAKSLWLPFPVEYKRGRLRKEQGYMVQLCAQAMCLEEMLCCEIEQGAIFFGKTRRRLSVTFDLALRKKTRKAALRLHELLAADETPPPTPGNKCKACSMRDICLPLAGKKSAQRYCASVLDDLCKETPLCEDC